MHVYSICSRLVFAQGKILRGFIGEMVFISIESNYMFTNSLQQGNYVGSIM